MAIVKVVKGASEGHATLPELKDFSFLILLMRVLKEVCSDQHLKVCALA
jgi:hypothetical protein